VREQSHRVTYHVGRLKLDPYGIDLFFFFLDFAAPWGSLLLFNTVIVILTIFRAGQVWKAGRIVHIFLRDGAETSPTLME